MSILKEIPIDLSVQFDHFASSKKRRENQNIKITTKESNEKMCARRKNRFNALSLLTIGACLSFCFESATSTD